MKRTMLSAALALAATVAQAEPMSIAEMKVDGGSMFFELWDEELTRHQCPGLNASAAVARFATQKRMTTYGTGCWSANISGYITVMITSFADGRTRTVRIHNSAFKSLDSKEFFPDDIQKLIALADEKDDRCRGGSGDDDDTWKACEARDELVAALEAKGYCWGDDSQFGYEKSWRRCS